MGANRLVMGSDFFVWEGPTGKLHCLRKSSIAHIEVTFASRGSRAPNDPPVQASVVFENNTDLIVGIYGQAAIYFARRHLGVRMEADGTPTPDDQCTQVQPCGCTVQDCCGCRGCT